MKKFKIIFVACLLLLVLPFSFVGCSNEFAEYDEEEIFTRTINEIYLINIEDNPMSYTKKEGVIAYVFNENKKKININYTEGTNNKMASGYYLSSNSNTLTIFNISSNKEYKAYYAELVDGVYRSVSNICIAPLNTSQRDIIEEAKKNNKTTYNRSQIVSYS